MRTTTETVEGLFGPGPTGGRGVLWPRWIFLRCLGLIFFSAFYSLAFQVEGLIGPDGILPAGSYLREVAAAVPGLSRFFWVPTVLWFGAGKSALAALVWGGLLASVLLVCNVWPRLTLAANYAFLNYLVLVLGFLLLDDRLVARLGLRAAEHSARPLPRWRMATAAVALVWIFYATVMPWFAAGVRPLALPVRLLAPFRIANRYGLFAVMTRARYEIEFQGSRDGGRTWIPYPFRYKPQDVREAPGLYAPYQPRFEWNLWFASLGSSIEYPWVTNVEVRLLQGSRDVLALFRRDPFAGRPPNRVRAVRWQYWFTDPATKRKTGAWWRREESGPYADELERTEAGTIEMR